MTILVFFKDWRENIKVWETIAFIFSTYIKKIIAGRASLTSQVQPWYDQKSCHLWSIKALYFQSSGQANNCQIELLFKWSDQSCTPSTTPKNDLGGLDKIAVTLLQDNVRPQNLQRKCKRDKNLKFKILKGLDLLTLKSVGFFLPVQHKGVFSTPICQIRSRHPTKLKL